MTMTYIETVGITNEWLRAVAGAHCLCAGYPDGVPETWRTPEGGVAYAGQIPENAGKHFIDATRAFPDGELDPAALLGPVAEPVDGLRAWVEYEQEHGGALGRMLRGDWPDRDAAGDEEC